MKQDGYQPRDYHHWVDGKDLVSFTVTVKETDLYIRAATDLRRKAQRIVFKYREQLEAYIQKNPRFESSLEPLPVPAHAPRIVMGMIEAGRKAGVGPMAAVAGAMAEEVGKELLAYSPEVIVENGGDIFLSSRRERVVGIYAGPSPLTGKIGLVFGGQDTPIGICTSSGTIGPSLSFGQADAVVAVAKSATLADAAATAIGNLIVQPDDIPAGIEYAQGIEGLTGVVIIQGDKIGLWGQLKLCEIETATTR